MIECKELAGKIIRVCRIDKDATNGPEIHMQFTDGTTFSICLKTDISIETTGTPSDKNQPQLVMADNIRTDPR
jgi:hypothetical protein